MLSKTFWSRWQILGLVLAVSCLFVWGKTSVGQSVFDPYQPDSSPYISSSFPTLPNNLALPGQAREASEYQNSTTGRSSGGAFDRFVNDDDSDFGSFGAQRRGGIGVPYFDVARQSDRTVRRDSPAVTKADKAFLAFEADKTRRYQNAMKQKDPAQRAKLLREVAQMQPPQSTSSRGAEPRKTTPKRVEAARPGTSEALAAQALAEVKERPAAGRTLDARPTTRRPQELLSPTRRPPPLLTRPLPTKPVESDGQPSR